MIYPPVFIRCNRRDTSLAANNSLSLVRVEIVSVVFLHEKGGREWDRREIFMCLVKGSKKKRSLPWMGGYRRDGLSTTDIKAGAPHGAGAIRGGGGGEGGGTRTNNRGRRC